jgi:hypothetical protein
MAGEQGLRGRRIDLVMIWRQEGTAGGCRFSQCSRFEITPAIAFSYTRERLSHRQIEQLRSAFKRPLGRQTGGTRQFNGEAAGR